MRSKPTILAYAACLLALWLRLRDLGELTLWNDEAFTWADAQAPLAAVLGARVNVHPPLYVAFVHFWLKLAGDSEYALRLPSALGSVIAIPALWALGRRLGGAGVGLVAALVMALSPLALAYGREARMYGPLMSQAALGLLLAERVRCLPVGRRWTSYAALTATAFLTHYTAAALWAATGLRLLWRRGWLLAQLAIGVVAAAWLVVWWRNRDAWSGLVWLPWTPYTPPARELQDWATSVGGLATGPYGALSPPAGALAALILCLAVIGLAVLIRARQGAALSLGLLALGPLAGMIAMEVFRPNWQVRFTLVGLPALFLLASLGATALWRVGPLLLVGGQVYALAVTPPTVRDDWRGVAAEVRRQAAPGEVALGGAQALAGYYLHGVLPVLQRPVAIGRPPEAVAADLDADLRGAPGAWLVPARDGLMDPGDLVGSTLERYVDRREVRTIGGVEVAHLVLRPHDRIALASALRPVDATFGGAIHLLGYAAERSDAVVNVSLEMKVERPLPEDYKVFAHLLDAGGATVAQKDDLVRDPDWRATSQMPPGTRLRLEIAIRGSTEKIAAGRAVGVGLYELGGAGARLPIVPPVAEDRLVLRLDG